MKKIITFLAFVLTFSVFAQSPQGFNYQATVRNSAGVLITNQNVFFKFNILQNTATGVPVFSETHFVPTDGNGQVSIVIGQGTATIGTFTQINWATGIYYLGIELNTGNGYVNVGSNQLLSVPFALYANNSGTSQINIPNLASVLAENNSANNTKIINLQDPINLNDGLTKSYLVSEIEVMNDSISPQIEAIQKIQAAPLPQIKIGTQNWTIEEHDLTIYTDGTPIPEVKDQYLWANLTTGAWCYYNNDSSSNEKRGKLYNWYAIMGIHNEASLTDPSLRKQFAPVGWHVPSDAEWTILTDHLGGVSIAGGKMKEEINFWSYPNNGATDEAGFIAKGTGYRNSTNGMFVYYTFNGCFWSTTENSELIWFRRLNYLTTEIYRESLPKQSGFSVRFIKD